jgi:BirA family biotin operon repressor/biotin-[acetyl-CoA-carboxylase] ligase
MPSQAVQISLIGGVAVVNAIKLVTALRPTIKWPNDIILGGKKAGGILTEMSCELDGVNYVVLGIGINVNTPNSLLADQTGGIATSLAEKCGEPVSRVRFVRCLLGEFEACYSEFLATGFDSIREKWKALNNTIGAWVKVIEGKDQIEGEVLDIDSEGFLLVRKEDGGVERIISGDVCLSSQTDNLTQLEI